MCVFFVQLDLPEATAQFVCVQQPNYNHPYCNHKNILLFFFFISALSTCWFSQSLSPTPFISLCLLLCLSPFLHFWLVVSTWWIASKWRMLWVPYFERFYLKRGGNWRYFSPHCICSSDSFLHSSATSLPSSPSPTTICVSVLTSASPLLSLSPLSGSAGRECHGVGGRHGPDLLPPAELRWINRGHPESPPADSFLQRHKRCVAVCAVVFTQINSFSSAALTFAAGYLNTLARTRSHLRFTFFFFLLLPSFFLFAYVLSLPLKRFHIKKSDNPGVNLRDGVILCPNSATTLTALKA